MSTGYFLRKYDRTTCGGVIYPSQDKFKILGLPVARAGDSVTCGKDGKVYQIMGSVPKMAYKGIGLAGSIHSKSTCPCMAELLPSCEKAKYSTDHMVLSPSAMRASVFDLGTPQHAQAAHKPVKHPDEELPSTCACDRDITMAEFKLIATGVTDENTLRSYLDSLNLWMPWHGITTCRAKAHFLSQACGETGEFKYMAEIGGKTKKYAPYYGRGILMLTHKDNYIKYSQYANIDVGNDPNELTSAPNCIISGIWAYSYLLKLNDKAEKDDFIYVTARINGGFNGYNARLSSFNKVVKILKAEHLNKLCTNGQFKFEESKIYDNRVYSQEWGLWHDPHYPKDKGTGKNKIDALAGYRRALNLTPNDKNHEVIRKSLNNKINAL
ncbi:hypothetical protein FOT62_08355 [Serratia marcescens]|uniref:Pyocin large subunit n=1 Tax=Serratia marcescens TaxID=615 RepID=A0A5C7CJH7_SERMA|nr:PAAR domain-containing protein [Serratia marcescens]TXE36967.1 hypothetical protein FOT62_08355 [Serratia marcescens]TXE61374.1 hypothetical protein FOT56_18645 [Serratia marcescens]